MKERRIRPHATPRPPKEARPPRPPQPNYYLAKKREPFGRGLRYDYALVAEEHRELVQRAALEIRARLKRTVEDMIEIGRRLNEVKQILPHGEFEKWIRDEFGMGLATASEFRNVADRFAANIQNLYLLPVSIVRRLAAPSVPDEAIAAVIEAAASRDKALPFKEAMAIVKPYLPVKVPAPTGGSPSYGPPGEQGAPLGPKQLPGPVAEPEPDPTTIEAEYTVIAPAPALTFAEWWAMMPKEEMSLTDWLLIFETAKVGASHVRSSRPALNLSVTNLLVPLSHLIHAIEKELKRE